MTASSDLDALGAQLRNYHVHAALLDRAQPAGGYLETHEALLTLQPESLHVQVGEKTASLAIVRMRDRITDDRALAGDLTDSGHGCCLENEPPANELERRACQKSAER